MLHPLVLLAGPSAKPTVCRQTVDTRNNDTRSDTWAGTDGLGRRVSTFETVGHPRKNRYVGVFYFLWHDLSWGSGPFDNSKILAKDPDAMTKPNSPLWGPLYAPHHWGEPLFGYYLSEDDYVLRKHAQMLSDAGVDVIIFDVTNQLTYPKAYMKLLEVFADVRAHGGKTPQVAFLCPFWDPVQVVRQLYHDLYAPRIHPELWFQWKGKPLILADPDALRNHTSWPDSKDPADALSDHRIGESFTVNEPFTSVGAKVATYAASDTSMTLSLYRMGGKTVRRTRFERVHDNAWVRFTFRHPLPPGTYVLEMTDPKGRVAWWTDSGPRRFMGQSTIDGKSVAGNRALEVSTVAESRVPPLGFFTFRKPQPDYFEGPTAPNMWSWLEAFPQNVYRDAKGHKEQMSVGVAQNAVDGRLGSLSEDGARGRSWHSSVAPFTTGRDDRGLNFREQFELALKADPEFVFVTGWNEWIAGRFNEFNGVKNPVMFVDEFNQEFSRDIEPMRGGHGDAYYYELVDFIRRFKGARPPEPPGDPMSIDLDKGFGQWGRVRPEFRDDVSDTAERDHDGWNRTVRYVNHSGRNDFVLMKVARDERYVYFYARTRDTISPYTDPWWMTLYITVKAAPGGISTTESRQYVLNRSIIDSTTTTIEEGFQGGVWRTRGKCQLRVDGSELQIAVPRTMLRLPADDEGYEVDFKWSDDVRNPSDPLQFTTDGDSAPNGRFFYRYIVPRRQ